MTQSKGRGILNSTYGSYALGIGSSAAEVAERLRPEERRSAATDRAQPVNEPFPPPSSSPPDISADFDARLGAIPAHIATPSLLIYTPLLHLAVWTPPCDERLGMASTISSNSTLCPSDNLQITDQSTFWDEDGLNWDTHRIGWVIAGSCALVVGGAICQEA